MCVYNCTEAEAEAELWKMRQVKNRSEGTPTESQCTR